LDLISESLTGIRNVGIKIGEEIEE